LTRAIVVEPVGGLTEMGHHHLLLDLAEDSFVLDCGALASGPEDPGVERIVAPLEPALRRYEAGRLRGLLLTHAHRDHIGAVADLLNVAPDLPVYGTDFTLALVRRHLEATRFSRGTPSLRTVKQGSEVLVGETRLRWLRVTHSIPSASSLALSSPAGVVVHSGDFRLQERPLLGAPSDEDGLRALGDVGVDLALVDSTNAGLPGSTRPEWEVVDHLVDRIADVRGRVVVTTFSSHVERIAACIEVGARTGRQVAVYGRSVERVVAEARHVGLLPLKKYPLRDVQEVMALPPDQGLLVVTGTQGEFRAPLARMARGEDPRVRLGPGDLVAWSARVIPGQERAVGVVVERLLAAGVEVHPPWAPGPALHGSGHGHADEVRRWLSWVRPRFVLPVHGQRWHVDQARRTLASIEHGPELLAATSGERLEIEPDSGAVQRGPGAGGEAIVVVGGGRWSASEPSLRQRRRLGLDGAATVVVPWDGRRTGPPQVVTLGIFAQNEREAVERKLEEEVAAELSVLQERLVGKQLQDEAGWALRRAIKRRTGTRVVVEARLSPISPPVVVENDKA
jgi:ribonuclease J